MLHPRPGPAGLASHDARHPTARNIHSKRIPARSAHPHRELMPAEHSPAFRAVRDQLVDLSEADRARSHASSERSSSRKASWARWRATPYARRRAGRRRPRATYPLVCTACEPLGTSSKGLGPRPTWIRVKRAASITSRQAARLPRRQRTTIRAAMLSSCHYRQANDARSVSRVRRSPTTIA
jgi:hypothetical protein